MVARPIFRGGKLLILGMFVLALGAAGASFWYRRHETWRALEFFGTDAVETIAGPDRVEALRLAPSVGAAADLTVGAARLRIADRRDVTHAAGFTNAREALTFDRNFRWEPVPCQPNWAYALRFTRGQQTATVLFSFSVDCSEVTLSGGRRRVGLGPIAAVLEKLLRSQWPDSAPPRAAASAVP